MEGKWEKGRRTFVAVVFVAVVDRRSVIAHVIAHVARAPRVGHVACVGHATSVGVQVWVGGTFVGAVVLQVHEAGSLFLELVEIHDDGCFDEKGDTPYRMTKAVKERMSWN